MRQTVWTEVSNDHNRYVYHDQRVMHKTNSLTEPFWFPLVTFTFSGKDVDYQRLLRPSVPLRVRLQQDRSFGPLNLNRCMKGREEWVSVSSLF